MIFINFVLNGLFIYFSFPTKQKGNYRIFFIYIVCIDSLKISLPREKKDTFFFYFAHLISINSQYLGVSIHPIVPRVYQYIRQLDNNKKNVFMVSHYLLYLFINGYFLKYRNPKSHLLKTQFIDLDFSCFWTLKLNF